MCLEKNYFIQPSVSFSRLLHLLYTSCTPTCRCLLSLNNRFSMQSKSTLIVIARWITRRDDERINTYTTYILYTLQRRLHRYAYELTNQNTIILIIIIVTAAVAATCLRKKAGQQVYAGAHTKFSYCFGGYESIQFV